MYVYRENKFNIEKKTIFVLFIFKNKFVFIFCCLHNFIIIIKYKMYKNNRECTRVKGRQMFD